MVAYFYEWLQNIVFYLIVISAVMQMIPNDSYKKYIRFFTGLILIVMLANPIMKVIGMQKTFSELYQNAVYQQKIREIKEATQYLEDVSLEDVGTESEGESE